MDGLRLPPKTADTQAVSCLSRSSGRWRKDSRITGRWSGRAAPGCWRGWPASVPDTLPETGGQDKKMALVKQAMQYMYAHFDRKSPSTTSAVRLGSAKCYFCHVFKEVTGQTAGRYLNYIRCSNARAAERAA